jgi:hypothetical protein
MIKMIKARWGRAHGFGEECRFGIREAHMKIFIRRVFRLSIHLMFFFFFGQLFHGCQTSKTLSTYDELISHFEKWRLDTMGCKHFREQLIPDLEKKEEKLFGATKADTKLILGQPEYEYRLGEYDHFLYFIDGSGTDCSLLLPLDEKNGEFMADMIYSIDIVFKDTRLTSINFAIRN